MWFSTCESRLTEWYAFRQSLNDLDLKEACQKTTHLWSYAPFVNFNLDPADPSGWPDPWILLNENCYCDVSKALAMIYTLALSKHGVNDFQLLVLQKKDTREFFNVAVVNNELILNLIYDSVVNTDTLKKSYATKYRYDSTALRLENFK